MDLDRIRTATEQAVCVSVQSIQLPGIVDARARSVAVTSPRLQRVATQLTRTSRPKRDQACGWNRVVLASLQC